MLLSRLTAPGTLSRLTTTAIERSEQRNSPKIVSGSILESGTKSRMQYSESARNSRAMPGETTSWRVSRIRSRREHYRRTRIHALLRSLPSPQITPERLPTVLSFSTECENLKTTQELEQQLLAHFRQTFRRPAVRAEASQFNGESLSIRLATWDFDVDKLEGWSLSPWELLEIEAASTVYGSEGAVALASAIEDTYNIFYAKRHGCPECGGEVVMSGCAGDTGEFGLATCTACGWEDYHP